MSRNISPLGVRLPAEVKQALSAQARTNKRSLNAEIVLRLEKSLVEQTPLIMLGDVVAAADLKPEQIQRLSKRLIERLGLEGND